MNSAASSPAPPPAPSRPTPEVWSIPRRIVLEVWSDRPVPSLKNSKRVCGNRLFTKKEVKARIEAIIRSFVSQSRSVIAQAIGTTTLTTPPPRYLTRLCIPENDSPAWIHEVKTAKAELPPGMVARVTIERIDP